MPKCSFLMLLILLDLFTLLYGFLLVVTCIRHSWYIYGYDIWSCSIYLPNKTKMKFDKDYKACLRRLWTEVVSWLACPALGEDLILLDQMDGDWQRWFLVTCPLWTGWLLLLYSIYNIQRHVSIKSLIFFKLWITRITLLVWMPGCFQTKMKNLVNKSPNKRESYKVHTINFLLLPSLPLPVHQLQPMGRPALPDLLLGLRASPRMPPSLSGGLGGIHFCYLTGHLLDWSRF